MKFALLHFPQLDRKSVSDSNRALIKEAKRRKHTMDLINAYDCQIDIDRGVVLYKGKDLPSYDAILVRPGIGEDTLTELSLVRQLETLGYTVVNTADAIAKVKNKAWQYQLLKQGNFPIPATWIVQSKESFERLIKDLSFPLVIKTIQGNQGTGVMLAESLGSLRPLMDYFSDLHQTVLLQEYIEASGEDIRLFVVGGEVVASMKRKAPKGEFRSNAQASCKTLAVKVTKEEKTLAIKAANYIGLDIAGVDLIRGSKKTLLLEVNANPGLTFVSKASGVQVASCVIEYMENL